MFGERERAALLGATTGAPLDEIDRAAIVERVWAKLGELGEARPEGTCPPRTCAILVGSPASGKTRLALALSEVGFIRVSRDAQGARHLREFSAALEAGHPVCVDNTNPRAADRAPFARDAAAAGYLVLLCHVSTPKELCFHLNGARCQLDPTGVTKEVPAVALHTYWKRLEAPTEKEAAAIGGCLVVMPFVPDTGAPREIAEWTY